MKNGVCRGAKPLCRESEGGPQPVERAEELAAEILEMSEDEVD